jgi:myo-inositol 2-dehydrogenase/D-chiro-inositol 1-dehydrogenase
MTAKTPETRRDFLKTAATGAATVAASLATLSNVHAAGSDTIKVGLIGCGGRGTGAADNVLHSSKNVQIVAIGDVFKFRLGGCRNHLQKLAQKDHIKQLGNSVDLPDERCFDGLDAFEKVIKSDANYIILATPPGFRPVHIEAAVAAGKNIFTEKPVCVDGTGARKVFAAYESALSKKLGIVAGTQRRHQLSYVETMKRLHQGELGDVTALRAYWNGGGIWFRNRAELKQHGIPDTDLAFQLHNWYHFVWTCGDHICEQHVHNLDACNWAMESALGADSHPVRCVGMGGRTPGNPVRPAGNPRDVGNIFDNFAIDFEYKNGVHMLSMCRQIPNTKENISEGIACAKGMVNPDGWLAGKAVLTNDQRKTAVDPYVQEHTDLIASIREGKPLNELKTVAQASLTAVMGRMASYTGKEVTWDKALNSKLDTMPAKLSWDMSIDVPEAAIPGKTPLI